MSSYTGLPTDEEKTIGGLHAFLLSTFQNLFSLQNQISLLDVGCGSGIWLRRLSQQTCWDLHGVDIQAPENTDGFSFYQVDVSKNSLPENLRNKFSVVTCIEVIEHVENPGHFLDMIADVLMDRGTLVLTTPNTESLRARLRSLLVGKVPNFDNKGDPTHIFPVLHDSLVKLLRPRSMTIERVCQYPANKKNSLMYRPLINISSQLLNVFLPNAHYGDICVYVIRKG